MKSSGNLIGRVVGEVGKRKAVQELTIEDLTLMSIAKNLGSMSGLTGEYKYFLKNLYHLFGKKRWKNNIIMIRKHWSKN
jgi:hypothetical protein